MRFILRPVAYGLWLLALGVSIALAWQFHGGDNTVALSIALLALGLSAFGVIFARDAIHRRDGFAALCGVILWVIGAVFFAIVEIGFWDSAYSRHYADYQTVKTAKVRSDALNDKKWDALTTGQLPEMPTQIQAKIDAAKMSERWAATKQCADATTAPSRDFCRSYFQLHEKLAEAQQRITLEAQFSQGIAEKEGHIVHNLLAGAEVLNRRLDLNDNRLAADIVIFAAWALLFLARDLGGVVANPLGRSPRPVEARTAAKAPEATTTAVTIPSPAAAIPLPPESRTRLGAFGRRHVTDANTSPERVKEIEKTEHVTDDKSAHSALNSADGTDFDGPGTPAPMPEAPKIEEVAESSRNVLSFFRDDGKGPEAPRGKKRAHKPEAKASAWVEDCCSLVEGRKEKSSACWKSYLAYCEATGKKALTRNRFSNQLNVLLAQETGSGRKRDGGGSVFGGIMIDPIVAQKKMRVA